MKNPWVIIGLLAAVLIGGSVWYSSHVSERNNVGVELTAHVKGNTESSVKLVEYSDFQCPACASFQPALERIMTEFGDKISFEYKHFPLPIHPFADEAARAAEAASQQGKFFEYHDALFANQAEWAGAANPTAFFAKYANEIGLDETKFKQHYNASLIKGKVKAEFDEARELGITATPTFYLNGAKMEIKTFEDFYNQIAQAVGATTTTEVAPVVEFGI
jgi:protein-disulfide isomerase